MPKNISQKFKIIVLAFLAVGLLGFFSVCTLSMHAESGQMANCDMSSMISSQAEGSCASYHLGILQSVSEVTPQDFAHFLVSLLILAIVFTGLLRGTLNDFLSVLARVVGRRLKFKYKEIFYLRLGFWLRLFEKRDPAYAFSLA